MIALLKRVWPENRDYHQGLGYVCSLLMLLFDADTTARILLRLTREERYTPGYWRAAPESYVRDAMVYARLVAERYPAVDALLTSACVVPESYASNGSSASASTCCTYAALFDFVEAFLAEGHIFLFKFALALVGATSEKLLACKPTDVNLIFEILRLDIVQYPDDFEGGKFFTRDRRRRQDGGARPGAPREAPRRGGREARGEDAQDARARGGDGGGERRRDRLLGRGDERNTARRREPRRWPAA